MTASRVGAPHHAALVSVIMIVLDEERFIDEAIRSVVAQTYPCWELIVVDDGCRDASPAIAAAHADADPRVRLVSHPGGANCGMSASRNLGLAHARGELVAFLDADDVYRPQKLERQVRLLAEHPDAAMVYGRTQHWYSWTDRPEDDRDQLRTLGVDPDALAHAPTLVSRFLRGQAQTPGTCGILARKSAVEAVGGFDPSFRGMFEDQVLITKICLTHDVYVESGSWDRYRKHPASCTRRALAAGEWARGRSPSHERFLRWLHDHVDRNEIRDVAVRAALHEQLQPYDDDRRHRPRPAPLTGPPGPRWSVMIPTYHCAHTLRAALDSVLEQDPGRAAMQVMVVDDGSTSDDPEAVVSDLNGAGSHRGDRIGFVRHATNVGHTRTFNDCLTRSRGELVHLLHGDDMVRAGFYAQMETIFADNPHVVAAFCRHAVIDGDGRVLHVARREQLRRGVIADWLPKIATGQRLQPPAMVVRRSAYEAVGGFDQRIAAYGEDWEMWTRLAAFGAVWYEPETLACYRVHTGTISNRSLRTGANMHDIRQVIELNRSVLPASAVERLTRIARANNARGALRRSLRLYDSGDAIAAKAQFRQALATSRAPGVLLAGGETLARVAWRIVRHRVGTARANRKPALEVHRG